MSQEHHILKKSTKNQVHQIFLSTYLLCCALQRKVEYNRINHSCLGKQNETKKATVKSFEQAALKWEEKETVKYESLSYLKTHKLQEKKVNPQHEYMWT